MLDWLLHKKKTHLSSKEFAQMVWRGEPNLAALTASVSAAQASREKRNRLIGAAKRSLKVIGLLIRLPIVLAWNLLIVLFAVGLTIAWVVFVFGSVIGAVILLVFLGPSGLLLPLALLGLLKPLWVD